MANLKGMVDKEAMEKEQLSTLFRQHYRQMYGMARSLLYDEHEAKDVVSDIFEHLLGADTCLLPDTEAAYLFTSVRRQCMKRLRQKSNRQRIERLYANEQLVADDPQADEERLTSLLAYARRHLSEQEQRLFRQRFVLGMTYDDMAQAHGISRVAIWKHLSHLMKTMRQYTRRPAE